MARGAMKAAISAARGAREQPNRTPIPRDGGGKGSVYPPPQQGGGMQAKPMPGVVVPPGGLNAKPMPGVGSALPGPRFTPQVGGGEQNSGGMIRTGPPMKGPRPDMQQIDQDPGFSGGALSRSFPPNSGPTMDPRQVPGFLPPRLQKQVDAGTMSQGGAENRFNMFQQGQLPGQQARMAMEPQAGQAGGMAPGGPNPKFMGAMPGGEQMDEYIAAAQQAMGQHAGRGQQFQSLRADGMAGGGMADAGQPPAPMQAGGGAGMGVQMQNPQFRDQLKQMLQQRMAGAQPGGGGGGGPFGGAPPRYMA